MRLKRANLSHPQERLPLGGISIYATSRSALSTGTFAAVAAAADRLPTAAISHRQPPQLTVRQPLRRSLHRLPRLTVRKPPRPAAAANRTQTAIATVCQPSWPAAHARAFRNPIKDTGHRDRPLGSDGSPPFAGNASRGKCRGFSSGLWSDFCACFHILPQAPLGAIGILQEKMSDFLSRKSPVKFSFSQR